MRESKRGDGRVAALVGELERRGSAWVREAMPTRYGIVTPKAFGVPVGTIRQIAKPLGRDHELAQALWATGWYEARMLAAFVADPERVTPGEMDRWARDFDNWAICDTVCFHLWDRTPHAWKKIEQWSRRRDEFVKRAAFALFASLALHDRRGPDEPFVRALTLIERAAPDDRNFVKKAVSWGLRAVGRRKGARTAAAALARRLAGSDQPGARWVGKDACRDLSRPRRSGARGS